MNATFSPQLMLPEVEQPIAPAPQDCLPAGTFVGVNTNRGAMPGRIVECLTALLHYDRRHKTWHLLPLRSPMYRVLLHRRMRVEWNQNMQQHFLKRKSRQMLLFADEFWRLAPGERGAQVVRRQPHSTSTPITLTLFPPTNYAQAA